MVILYNNIKARNIRHCFPYFFHYFGGTHASALSILHIGYRNFRLERRFSSRSAVNLWIDGPLTHLRNGGFDQIVLLSLLVFPKYAQNPFLYDFRSLVRLTDIGSLRIFHVNHGLLWFTFWKEKHFRTAHHHHNRVKRKGKKQNAKHSEKGIAGLFTLKKISKEGLIFFSQTREEGILEMFDPVVKEIFISPNCTNCDYGKGGNAHKIRNSGHQPQDSENNSQYSENQGVPLRLFLGNVLIVQRHRATRHRSINDHGNKKRGHKRNRNRDREIFHELTHDSRPQKHRQESKYGG